MLSKRVMSTGAYTEASTGCTYRHCTSSYRLPICIPTPTVLFNIHTIFLFTAGTTWLLVRSGYKVVSYLAGIMGTV